MASMFIDDHSTYIEVLWQPSIGKAVIRVGDGSLHLTVDEAETVVAGLTAAIEESKTAKAAEVTS